MATLQDVIEQLKKNNRSEAARDGHHTRHFQALATSITNLQKTMATSVAPPPAPPPSFVGPPAPTASQKKTQQRTNTLLQKLTNFTVGKANKLGRDTFNFLKRQARVDMRTRGRQLLHFATSQKLLGSMVGFLKFRKKEEEKEEKLTKKRGKGLLGGLFSLVKRFAK